MSIAKEDFKREWFWEKASLKSDFMIESLLEYSQSEVTLNFPKIKQQQKKSILAINALLQVIDKYQIGDKLPPERQLALEMDISRNTLREAIAALQVMGIIGVRHSQGNFIIKLPDEVTLMQSLDSIFHPASDPFAMVEARVAFEPGAAYMAALKRTPSDVKRMKGNVNDLIQCLREGDLTGYSEADMLFHLNIARATHNEVIIETITPMVSVLRTPLWRAIKKGLDEELFFKIRSEEHNAIFQHISNGQAREAANAVYSHIKKSMERFLHERE